MAHNPLQPPKAQITLDRTGATPNAGGIAPAQTATVDIAKGVAGDSPVDGDTLIDTDRVIKMAQIDEERFYADELTVVIPESSNPEDPDFVPIGVNGVQLVHRRSEDPVTLRRSAVALLCQAKVMILKQVKVTNDDGSQGYAERPVIRLAYPFSILHDPAGSRGQAWLKQALQNAA